MAPWSSNNRETEQVEEAKAAKKTQDLSEEDNPFIAFRRFADSQFNTLVEGLNAIPGLLSEVGAKAEEQQQQWSQMMRKEHGEPTPDGIGGWASVGFRSPPERSVAPTKEGREAARALLVQAREANVGADPARILRLYRDSNEHFGFDARSAFGNPEPQWLSVEWFKHSPYSPTQIEQHPRTHQQGSMWRAAFEDLLSADMEKEQQAWPAWTNRVNDQKLYSSWAQAPTDWMLGLQCRGILPPQLPNLYRGNSTRAMDVAFSNLLHDRGPLKRIGAPWYQSVVSDFERLALEISTFDEDEKAEQVRRMPTTEQDLYEHFLGKAQGESGSPATSRATAGAQQSEPPNSLANRQDLTQTSTILSSLSTTERTVLPDGTTTTKVVLKKRFADGREESTETVSTTHGSQETKTSAGERGTIGQNEQQQKNTDKKGWFWS